MRVMSSCRVVRVRVRCVLRCSALMGRLCAETDPSVQALLYPVALSNSSPYYLGITNHANSSCGYNITARLDGTHAQLKRHPTPVQPNPQ